MNQRSTKLSYTINTPTYIYTHIYIYTYTHIQIHRAGDIQGVSLQITLVIGKHYQEQLTDLVATSAVEAIQGFTRLHALLHIFIHSVLPKHYLMTVEYLN